MRVVLPAALALAALNAAWGLGSLSYFGDEVFSIDVARAALGEPMLDQLRATEINPPAYYVLLHGWIEATGADREVGLRLPSLLATLGLVAATAFLAARAAGPRAAAAAALLTALSPLVLTYAQQVRAYALAALLVAAAAAAAIGAARGGPRQRALLWASTALCVLAVWTHYTAWPVVAVIATWSLLVVPGSERRRRLPHPALVGVAMLATLPLVKAQFDRGSADQPSAALGGRTLLEVLATPFDGRDVAPIVVVALGALVVVAALSWCAVQARREGRASPLALVLACALVPVASLLLLGLAGRDVLWSRYTVVAAPFIVAAIAAGAQSASFAPRALAALALVLAVAGSVRVHSEAGRFAPARPLVEAAAADWRAGDELVLTLNATVNLSLVHYARRELPRGAPLRPPAPETFARAARDRRRLWLVTPELDREGLAPYLPQGARVASIRRFAAAAPLQLTLVVPR